MTSPNIPTMTPDDIRLPIRPFRNVYLVQNRDYWKACPFAYDKEQDLVLSFDFAVVHDVTSQDGTAEYLDHLVKSEYMERYNHDTYRFFASWFLDKNGQDIFTYRGIKISNAFRLYIWADITYTTHIFINLLALKHIRFENILAGTEDTHVIDILQLLGLKTENWSISGRGGAPEYYFPIFRWMNEQIYPSPIKRLAKIVINRILGTAAEMGGHLGIFKQGAYNVFIHPYHPTHDIIKSLNFDENINVVLENPFATGKITREKYIPLHWTAPRYTILAKTMISTFHERHYTRWHIEGIDICNYLQPIIMKRVSDLLPECLKRIDEIIDYFSKRRLHLIIDISNIGMTNSLLLNYCQKMNIPSYLIINGYLGSSYLDESKNALWINSYGTSIKEHYFAGMENVVCLGDPRMDAYAKTTRPVIINRVNPTIVIGASGYNNIDLNSYVAVEFDFLADILTACRTLIRQGRRMNIIIKVRPNGYIEQYSKFIQEYYPDIPVMIFDKKPMKQILSRADFYISIYSGTLFEASSLGIPVLYYKKDTEISYPPFDGKSELVTALTPEDLKMNIELFYEGDRVFDTFMDNNVLEKYVGPLDGRNLERNMNFVYSLLSTKNISLNRGDISVSKKYS